MSLCKVVAIFDEFRLEEVESKLIEHGVHGFTLHPVRGRGRYFDSFNENHLIKHIQMEIYVSEEQSLDLSRLISETAYSGAESEGLVSVVPVQSLRWIHDKREAQATDFVFRESRHAN
ncbi:P-II family nitrogen regulator [Teredinibacter haidensis]|uniref:P-II family nitrogen regulator n=1 Tax=Teredinibacter haidensis TaxID=2731755 RepID=UPI00094902A2|nr:P-II family nitrogen regulator [Teredinibacter haidensis]